MNLLGSQRKLLEKPKDLEYNFFKYNDPEAILCQTDIDKILNRPFTLEEDGKYLALQLLFSLSSL